MCLIIWKKEDSENLFLCSKNIYQLYCNQIKKLKFYGDIDDSIILKLLKKFNNIKKLDLSWCMNIKDYSFISKLNKLEILNLIETNVSDISFLENNKNIKGLELRGCKNIKDYSIILELDKLEKLYLYDSNISYISFLENNKNIKELYLERCLNINRDDKIFKRKDIKFFL